MKRFKLVPIKHFETLISGKKMCAEVDPTLQDTKESTGNERILRDVIEEGVAEQAQSEVGPSFQYVTKMDSTPIKGGKSMESDIPIFMPNATELPEYARASNLRKTYNDFSEILYSKDIPEDTKIKLYHIFRDKYDTFRNPTEKSEENTVITNGTKMIALERILARLPENKRELGKAVADILYNEESIQWFKYGYIFKPAMPKDEIDLRKLVNILIYKNTGTKKEIMLAYDIVKNIFPILEPYVINRKMLKLHDQIVSNQRMTQYVAW